MAIPSTSAIYPNEKCFRIIEKNELTPDYRALHRYQIVYVIRNDGLAEWRHDLGPASNFTAPEVVIPGAVPIGTLPGGRVKYEIVETVANLQAYARDHRARGRVGDSPEEIAHEMLKARERLQGVIDKRTLWNPSYKFEYAA